MAASLQTDLSSGNCSLSGNFSRLAREIIRAALCVAIFIFLGAAHSLASNSLVNVASAKNGAVAIADSEFGRYSASKAIDGEIYHAGEDPDGPRWESNPHKPGAHWIWVRFAERAQISKIVLHCSNPTNHPLDFVGEYSPDGGVTFFTIFSITNNPLAAGEVSIPCDFKPKMSDNFRLRILKTSGGDSAQVSEIEVFGENIGGLKSADFKQPAAVSGNHLLEASSADGLTIRRQADRIEFQSRWLRAAFSTKEARVTDLCWDSLGENKVTQNLLTGAQGGGIQLNLPQLFPGANHAAVAKCESEGNVLRYTILSEGLTVRWDIRVETRRIRFSVLTIPARNRVCRDPSGSTIVFDPEVTSVSPLANPSPEAAAPLPLLLHAADYGTALISSASEIARMNLTSRPGIHSPRRWEAKIESAEIPRAEDGLYLITTNGLRFGLELSVEACEAMPKVARDQSALRGLTRSWLNSFQYRPELGVLANNPLSDTAPLCLFAYTDPAVFTTPLPGDIEVIHLARQSLERYFTGGAGYGTGREDAMLDTYPSLLIAAWDVVRVTGDMEWLRRWLPVMETIASKAIRQDRDGDGLPESTRTGISGKFKYPTGNWWDQINFGHNDAYVCALSFRAFRGMADLERLAGRTEEAARFESQAEKIRRAYVPTFLNSETGVIAGWKDSQGKLHDYWFLFVNGIAITYGLVPDPLADQILDRCEAKMREVGYTNFALGLPGNLVPIPKSDYGMGSFGSPLQEDGRDTFGVFENGGASASYAYFYIQALYQRGRSAQAERILGPMIESFCQGRFQNGIGHGGEWRRWDGRPSGYEGFLADGYYAQMALVTGRLGIGFGPEGFRLEQWSPLKGKSVPLGLKYMGKVIETIQ